MPNASFQSHIYDSILLAVFSKRCDPDEHHPDCPQRPEVCPYTDTSDYNQPPVDGRPLDDSTWEHARHVAGKALYEDPRLDLEGGSLRTIETALELAALDAHHGGYFVPEQSASQESEAPKKKNREKVAARVTGDPCVTCEHTEWQVYEVDARDGGGRVRYVTCGNCSELEPLGADEAWNPVPVAGDDYPFEFTVPAPRLEYWNDLLPDGLWATVEYGDVLIAATKEGAKLLDKDALRENGDVVVVTEGADIVPETAASRSAAEKQGNGNDRAAGQFEDAAAAAREGDQIRAVSAVQLAVKLLEIEGRSLETRLVPVCPDCDQVMHEGDDDLVATCPGCDFELTDEEQDSGRGKNK